MARKLNYSFERRERERLKAEKKTKRASEKKEAREKKSRQSQAPAQSDGQNPLSSTSLQSRDQPFGDYRTKEEHGD